MRKRAEMSLDNETTFENKCAILAELWMDYRDDPQFQDFIQYNDLGLPLGYAVYTTMVEPKDIAIRMINESFDVLLAGLGIDSDTGFDTLEDILNG